MFVTVKCTFMGGCNYLWVGIGVCDCLKHIYGWVWLFRKHLWMGVTV